MAFDPTHLDDATLSNSNLTYVNASGSGASAARTTENYSSGKRSFQITFNATILEGDYNTAVGLADTGTTSFDLLTASGALGWFSNGQIVFAAVNSYYGAYVHGDVLTIAVDFTAHKLWVRVNSGNWNNDASADPATGANGIDISTLAGSSWRGAAMVLYISGAGGTIGSGALPSGFSNFLSSAGGIPNKGYQVNFAVKRAAHY